jgi:hypothetical protein
VTANDASLAAARALARSLNRGDTAALVGHFCEQIEFDSQSLLEPIFGKDSVDRYICTQLALAHADAAPLRAEIGLIDAETTDLPGVIVLQHGDPHSFWAPMLDASLKIARIFEYTMVPPPSTARGLGEFPGYDDAETAGDDAQDAARRRALFRAAAGPVFFHGFAISTPIAEQWLKPRLAFLANEFPGSVLRVHVHDTGQSSNARIREFAQQKRRFEILSYPAICVERGGKVFRGGRARQDLGSILADLHRLMR